MSLELKFRQLQCIPITANRTAVTSHQGPITYVVGFLVFMGPANTHLHTSRFHAEIREVFFCLPCVRVSVHDIVITVELASTHPRTPLLVQSLAESLVSVGTGYEELVHEQREPQRNRATPW